MTTPRERLSDLDEDVLVVEGFDDAIVGYAERCGQPMIAVYDRAKCIDVLVERDGLTHEEAEAFFEESVIGAWLGERTPLFLTRV